MVEFSIHWTPLLLKSGTRRRTGRPIGPPESIVAATLPTAFDALPTERAAEAPMTVIYRVQRGAAS